MPTGAKPRALTLSFTPEDQQYHHLKVRIGLTKRFRLQLGIAWKPWPLEIRQNTHSTPRTTWHFSTLYNTWSDEPKDWFNLFLN
jgi:hypothetical protein